MTNCLTLTGLRQLRLMQRKKQPMPDGWQDDVRAYIKQKERSVFVHNSRWRKDQLDEAKRIAKLLEVKV